MPSEFESVEKFLSTFFLWINQHPEEHKYVIKLEEGKIHFTIRIWSRRREIELHRTDENYPAGDPRRHEILFCISFFSIGRLLIAMKKMGIEKFGRILLRNKITVGKLNRYFSVLFPLNQENPLFDDFVRIKPRASGKKTVRLNSKFDFSLLGDFVTPEDALNHPIKNFTVYQQTKSGNFRMNGHVYRFPNTPFHGERSFIYFSDRMRKKLMRNFAIMMYGILKSIHFQNKEKVLGFMRKNILETYYHNHPQIKKMLEEK